MVSRRSFRKPVRVRSRRRIPWLASSLAVAAAAAAALVWPVADAPKAVADSPPAADRFTCEVARVTDGDTFRCADGVRVRLHAVAARELDETCGPNHPCPAASGAAAKAELERLVSGRSVDCARTGRSYNRVTAVCWTPARVEVNCALVRSGVAVIWPRYHRERPICA